MATSSVPSVKAALLAAIQAAAPLAALQAAGNITYAHPGKHAPKEAIYLGNARMESEDVPTLRPTPHAHTERYTVPVLVDLLAEGNDPQTCEERAWTLVGAVEDALRTNHTLGVSTVQWAKVEGKTPLVYQSDQGWAAMFVIDVGVQARI